MTNINKYKKGIAKAAIVCGALIAPAFLSSCSDWLETEPQNIVTLEKFWNDKSDVESVIMSCYSEMQSYGIISRMMIWGEFRSENVNYSGNGNDDLNLERLLKENITATNAYTYWGDFYTVINRCNTVLKYAPGVAASDMSYTQSQVDAHIAEVTALRSLCYFYLIRTFRDVPYSEEAFQDDSQTLAVEQTDFDTVLTNIINSLELVKDKALEAYPATGSYGIYFNTGRITKWAIYSLLADMYLWKQDYQKSLDYANIVIKHMQQQARNSKDISISEITAFNGYPLYGTCDRNTRNVYGRSFKRIFIEGNSEESIFELTFIKDSGSKQASNGPYSNFFGGQNRTPWVKASDRVGLDEIDALYNVFEKVNKGLDVRAYDSQAYQNKRPAYINKGTCSGAFSLNDIPTSTNFFKNSSWGVQYETEGNNHDSRNKANVIIYRLSDVMLIAAEAASQLIQQDGAEIVTEENDAKNLLLAFNLCNAINKRSLMQETLKDTLVLSDYQTKDAITELVYKERQREFLFEGKRYFDLVRHARRDGNTDYIRSHCSDKSTNLKSVIDSKMKTMDAIYWPVNLDEIKANKKLHQNPAFGSGENGNISVD